MINNEENLANGFFSLMVVRVELLTLELGQISQLEQTTTALPKPSRLHQFTPAETSACGILCRSLGRGFHNEFFVFK